MKKIPERGPEGALWIGVVLAQVFSGRMRTKSDLNGAAEMADAALDLFLSRVETEDEYQTRRRAENEARGKPPAV